MHNYPECRVNVGGSCCLWISHPMEGFVELRLLYGGEIFHHLSILFHHQIGPGDNAYMDRTDCLNLENRLDSIITPVLSATGSVCACTHHLTFCISLRKVSLVKHAACSLSVILTTLLILFVKEQVFIRVRARKSGHNSRVLVAQDQRDLEFGPELGPNCLQMLSADDSRLQAKERFMHSSDQLVPSYACTCKSPSYPFLCLVVNIYKLTNPFLRLVINIYKLTNKS